MGIGKVLGSISPVAGALTGKGAFGKGLTALADSGLGMLVPMSYVAGSQRDKVKAKRAEEETAAKRAPVSSRMKHGGKVKKMAKGGSVASKRADGCATKGKTRGKMV